MFGLLFTTLFFLKKFVHDSYSVYLTMVSSFRTMKKPRRRRYESESDYTKDADENSKILLREKYEMLKWTDTVEIKTPNLLIPTQIASYVESLPFCKITVSP